MGMFQYAVALVSADGTREEEVRPWVDTGAMYCQFPDSLLRGLGYAPNATRAFTMADGSTVSRPFGAVSMRIGTEVQPVHCVYDPSNTAMMLLGAIALEAFSLTADPVDGVLKPSIGLMLTLLPDEGKDTEE
jgi:predicted aspartyl protease